MALSDGQLTGLRRAVERELAADRDLGVIGPVRQDGPTGVSLALVERASGDVWDVTFVADPEDFELALAAHDDDSFQTFGRIVSANVVEWWFTRHRPDHNRSVSGGPRTTDGSR